MALPRVHKTIQDSLGNVVPQVQCSVYNEGTGVLATLWQDDAGTIPLPNPMISSTNYGSIDFYVAPGHFDLAFVKPGYSFETLYDMQVPQDDLTLGTMAQQDAANVAITGGTAVLSTASLTDASMTNATIVTGLGIGNAPIAGYQIYQAHNKAASTFSQVIRAFGTDANGHALTLTNMAGTPVGSIQYTGTATTFNTSSDVRLKHAITPLTGALGVVQALRPVHFLWNANDEPGEGFLAHELMRHVPAAVTGEPDAVGPQGEIVPQQVDHSRIVPWLVGALQETLAQVQALTARVNTLEQQLGV